MEAAILLEGGDLTEVREVARGDRKPEHKLRQACTSCLLKIAMSDAVSENGVSIVFLNLGKQSFWASKVHIYLIHSKIICMAVIMENHSKIPA